MTKFTDLTRSIADWIGDIFLINLGACALKAVKRALADLARWLWQTQSKILSKHHLSAARSLWQTQAEEESLNSARRC